jgi:peptide/bleomycin uptake transporter
MTCTQESDHLAQQRERVWSLLIEFSLIVSPAIVVNPVAKWISSVWRFSWRMALVRSYLRNYDVVADPVEGAAQRIQEDTQRFEDGIYRCGVLVLDSVLTLIVFTPVLLEVGERAHPMGIYWPPWLLLVAVVVAGSGALTSMVVGSKLVDLEVQNQRVEAEFRTKLVHLETSPDLVIENATEPPTASTEVDFDRFTTVRTPASAFHILLLKLWQNYRQLYKQFAFFNVWISYFEQGVTILPYLVAAPLMFAERDDDRISMGTLVKLSNSFEKVFGALAIVAENWTAVNAFRSVLRRLREFETSIYVRRRVRPLRDAAESADAL